jgi:hypothetical protein
LTASVAVRQPFFFQPCIHPVDALADNTGVVVEIDHAGFLQRFSAEIAAINSMRLLVVWIRRLQLFLDVAESEDRAPAAGPGFPEQAPSVKTIT